MNSQWIKDSFTKYNEFHLEAINLKFKPGKFYIFTNIGLIASGKSTICKNLEFELKNKLGDDLVNFYTVSSDQIRKEVEQNTDVTMLNQEKKREYI